MAIKNDWKIGDVVYSIVRDGPEGIVVGVDEKSGTIEIRPGSISSSTHKSTKEIVSGDMQREAINRSKKISDEIKKKEKDIANIQQKSREVKTKMADKSKELNKISDDIKNTKDKARIDELKNTKKLIMADIAENRKIIKQYTNLVNKYKTSIEQKKNAIEKFDEFGSKMLRTHTVNVNADGMNPRRHTEKEIRELRKELGYVYNQKGEMWVLSNEMKDVAKQQKTKSGANYVRDKVTGKKYIDQKTATMHKINRPKDIIEKHVAGVRNKPQVRIGNPIIENGRVRSVDAPFIDPKDLSSSHLTYVPVYLDTSWKEFKDPKTGKKTNINPETGKREREHKYSFSGVDAQKYRDAYKESEILSVTSIGNLITGGEINKMREEEKKLSAIIDKYESEGGDASHKSLKEQKEMDNIRKQAINLRGKLKIIDDASEYGTLFHRVIEFMESDEVSEMRKAIDEYEKSGGDLVEQDQNTRKKIDNYKKALKIFDQDGKFSGKLSSAKDIKKVLQYLTSQEDMGMGSRTASDLYNDVNAYYKYKKKYGIPNVAGSEMPLGGAINIGGKTRVIAGTLDQMFLSDRYGYGIKDLKTTSNVHPEYGLQLSLLSQLANAAGFNLKGGIGVTRVAGGKVYEHDFEKISEEKLVEILSKAFEILEIQKQITELQQLGEKADENQNKQLAEMEDKLQKLINEAQNTLGSGGRKVRIGQEEFEKDGKKIKYTTYDDMSLKTIGKKGKEGIMEFYESIKTMPDVVDSFIHSMYSTDERGNFYRSGRAWDYARANIPNKFNTSPEEMIFDYGKYGAMLGGLTQKDILSNYDRLVKQGKEDEAKEFVYQILRRIDEAIRDESESASKYEEAQIAKKMYSGLGENSLFYNAVTKGFKHGNTTSTFGSISNMLERDLVNDIGGNIESADIVKYRGPAQSIRKLQNAQIEKEFFIRNMNELGRGGFADIFEEIKADLGHGMPLDVIIEKYGERIKNITSSLSGIGERFNKELNNLGKESVINEFGYDEVADVSQSIIDSIVDFKKQVLDYVNASGLPKEIVGDIEKQIISKLKIGRDENPEMAAWRVARAVGIGDYMEEVLGDVINKANESGGINLPAEAYMGRLLSQQGYAQYQDSQSIKALLNNYLESGKGDIVDFLKEIIDNTANGAKSYRSEEMKRLGDQLKAIFDMRGEKGLLEVAQKLREILLSVDDNGNVSLDLSTRFKSFEKQGARAKILSGSGVGYYSEQPNKENQDSETKYGGVFLNKHERKYLEAINRYKELAEKYQEDLDGYRKIRATLTPKDRDEYAESLAEKKDWLENYQKEIDSLGQRAFFSRYKAFGNSPNRTDAWNRNRRSYINELVRRDVQSQQLRPVIRQQTMAANEMGNQRNAMMIQAPDGSVFMTGYFGADNTNDDKYGLPSKKRAGVYHYLIPKDKANEYKKGQTVLTPGEKEGETKSFIITGFQDSVTPYQKPYIRPNGDSGFENSTIDDYKNFSFVSEEEVKGVETAVEKTTESIQKVAESNKDVAEAAKEEVRNEASKSNIGSSAGGGNDGGGSGGIGGNTLPILENISNILTNIDQNVGEIKTQTETVDWQKLQEEIGGDFVSKPKNPETEEQKIYNQYLKEFYKTEKKIQELKENKARAKDLGEDTSGIAKQIRGLRGYQTKIKNMAKEELGDEKYSELSKKDSENAYRDKLKRELEIGVANKKSGRKAYVEEKQAEKESADKKKREAEELQRISEAQKIYNEYLQEEINLQKEIDKITEDINRKKKEGIDDADAKKQRGRLRRAKTSIDKMAKKEIIDFFGEDVWYNVSGEGAQSKRESAERQREFEKKEAAASRPQKILSDYNNYLDERLDLEDKIYKAQLKSQTTSGKERGAYEIYLGELYKELNLLDKKNSKIEKAAEVVDKQAAAEIKQRYTSQLALKNAERLAGNRGNVTLRDVITRDLGMVGMRFMNFGVISRLISKVPQSLNRVKQTTQQLEQALMNLRVVTGYNRKEGEALLVTYNSLSKQLGATTVEVANAADAWLRQGYSVADAEDLIAASMKLSKLGKIDSAQATKSLKRTRYIVIYRKIYALICWDDP